MTLILTVARPNAAYQSSDFQLTSPNGTVVSDAEGTKQVQITLKSMHLQLAFTGIAKLGKCRTIDWIVDEIKGASQADLKTLCFSLAHRCEHELASLSLKELLTIVLIASKPPRQTVVATISNSHEDRIEKNFFMSIQTVNRPMYFVNGYGRCVGKDERRRLKNLARDTNCTPQNALKRLAEINAICAKSSQNRVSEGCWASAQYITPQNCVTWNSIANGSHGSVTNLFNGVDLTEKVKATYRAKPGSEIRMRSSAGMTGDHHASVPLEPEGSPKKFTVDGERAHTILRSPSGVHCANLELAFPRSGFEIRRNQSVLVPFQVTISIANPMVGNFPKWQMLPWPTINFPPLTINGSSSAPHPGQHSANYGLEEGVLSVDIPLTSRSIRNVGYLQDDEELLLVCPRQPVALDVSGMNTKTSLGEAIIFWRARTDGTRGVPIPSEPNIISFCMHPEPVMKAELI